MGPRGATARWESNLGLSLLTSEFLSHLESNLGLSLLTSEFLSHLESNLGLSLLTSEFLSHLESNLGLSLLTSEFLSHVESNLGRSSLTSELLSQQAPGPARLRGDTVLTTFTPSSVDPRSPQRRAPRRGRDATRDRIASGSVLRSQAQPFPSLISHADARARAQPASVTCTASPHHAFFEMAWRARVRSSGTQTPGTRLPPAYQHHAALR
jgi:hypothetical protein